MPPRTATHEKRIREAYEKTRENHRAQNRALDLDFIKDDDGQNDVVLWTGDKMRSHAPGKGYGALAVVAYDGDGYDYWSEEGDLGYTGRTPPDLAHFEKTLPKGYRVEPITNWCLGVYYDAYA